MAGEEPPFLTVGTEVSAKYRGAFCEASIKAAKKLVKCKISFAKCPGTTTVVTDDCIKGTLRVSEVVEAKNAEGQMMEATILKLTDASLYTVVFDDGDERTLRRTSLCLKGERHFNVSETLDHLPLTDPENFGTPVVQEKKSRKRRRLSQGTSVDESDNEKCQDSPQEVVPSKRKLISEDSKVIGKVIIVTNGEKKRNSWYPALGVHPGASDADIVAAKDQCMVRSFKDQKYHIVALKDTKEFSREDENVGIALKGEPSQMRTAVERAIDFMENGIPPPDWEDAESYIKKEDSDSDETSSQESDFNDDPVEREKFFTKYYAFMEDRGTPVIKTPVLGYKDLDLFKFYKLVTTMGGMDKVTEDSNWRALYMRMDYPVLSNSASYNIRNSYKKYLYAFEMNETGDDMQKNSDTELNNEEEKERNEKPKQTDKAKGKKEVKTEEEEDERTSEKEQTDSDFDDTHSANSPDSEIAVDVVNDDNTESISNTPNGKSQENKHEINYGDVLEFEIGDKVQVKYGRGRNQRVYEAKITSIDPDADEGLLYCVHYSGWNIRYDEWIIPERVVGRSQRQTRKKGWQGLAKGKDIKESKEQANSKSTTPSKSSSKPTLQRRNSKTSPVPPSNPRSPQQSNGSKNSTPQNAPSPAKSSSSNSKPTGSNSKPSTPAKSSTPSKNNTTPKNPSSPVPATKTTPGRGRRRSERSTPQENGTKNGKAENQSIGNGKTPSGRGRKNSLSDSSNESNIVQPDDSAAVKPDKSEADVETKEVSKEKKGSNENNGKSGKTRKQHAQEKPAEATEDSDKKEEIKNEKPDNKKVKEPPKRRESTSEEKKDICKVRLNGVMNDEQMEQAPPVCTEEKKRNLENSEQDVVVKKPKVEENELKDVKELLMNDVPAAVPVLAPSTPSEASACKETTCCIKTENVSDEKQVESRGGDVAEAVNTTEQTDKASPEKNIVDTKPQSDQVSEEKAIETKATVKAEHPVEKHPKKHRRKRRNRTRQQSICTDNGNDSSSSPVASPSSGVKASPLHRPKISFSYDLEEIRSKQDSSERIRLLQDRLGEIRKAYSSLKAEVAGIDRKKKRLRKKREEAAEKEREKNERNENIHNHHHHHHHTHHQKHHHPVISNSNQDNKQLFQDSFNKQEENGCENMEPCGSPVSMKYKETISECI